MSGTQKDNAVKKNDHPAVTGMDVWQWPETRAFLDRLGHDWHSPTTRVVIDLPCANIVKITHEFNGIDMNEEID